MNLRSFFYAAGRILGDARAVQRGPEAIVERVARKTIWRAVGGLINQAFRARR